MSDVDRTPAATAAGAPRAGAASARLSVRLSPVWWLNLAIAAAATALFVTVVHDLPALIDPHLPWWGLAVGFLAAESCVVHLQFRRSAHSFSLGDLPLVFGLLFATRRRPRAGRAARDRRRRSRSSAGCAPVKLVFNLSQFALAASLATIVVHAVAPDGAALDPAHLDRGAARDPGERRDHGDADRAGDLALGGRAAPRHARADVRHGLRRDRDQHLARAWPARSSSRPTRARSRCWSCLHWSSTSPTAPT